MVRPILIADGTVIGIWTHASASLGAPPELFDHGADAEAVSVALGRFRSFLET
ncbi:hypothetical protein [Microbacterium sp. NPDC087591]|uniref:hypothetical protein n=1 Tax=Microbacterium sp. NPDC087591 TaxID=3364192 RepID=UPI003800EBBD